MKKQTTWLFYLLLFSVALSCTPKNNCTDTGGGKGGGASISVSPTHFGAYVDSCTIYIKYGTLNAPANGVYDDSLKCSLIDTIPTAKFTGLKPGIYYFYGKGYHTAYTTYVKGAVNYTMCNEHTQTLLLPTVDYNP